MDQCGITVIHNDKVAPLEGRADEVAGMAEVFKALADETRTKLLYLLSLDELCVCDLAYLLGSSVSSVSHHLRNLRNLRLVKARKDGKMVYYSLKDGHIAHIIGDMKEHMSEDEAKV